MSSSQRGQPGVFLPNTGPPQVCLVVAVAVFVHAMRQVNRAPLLLSSALDKIVDDKRRSLSSLVSLVSSSLQPLSASLSRSLHARR